MSAPPGAARLLLRPRMLLVLLGALACAACAPSAPARDDLDPLFRGTAGQGEHEFDPATLPKPRPARPEQAQEAEPCDHVWQALQDGTHGYVDLLTGLPALCTPLRCARCGQVRHECQGRRR